MKVWMQAGVAIILFLFCGCSRGSLDDRYDRYLNVFGLHYAPPPTAKGGMLGRVLQQDGLLAAWSQVHARPLFAGGSTPASTTTNGKGGFFIADLTPGPYRLFVVAPTGEGIARDIQIVADQVIEDEDIRLQPLARVSGTATLEDEPVHSGVMIYAMGTPFSAFTDHEGYYYLEMPAGDYEFRAEKDGFVTYESPEPKAIQNEVTLDFELDSNPWPSAKVTVDSEDGFVVRGLTTRLRIEPVPGVRHMRINRADGGGGQQAWTKVTSEIEIEHDGPGYRSLEILFVDAYGKYSEPVTVRYYNTELDASWSILHGYINKPVRIKTGSKVMFLTYGAFALKAEQSIGVPIPGDDLVVGPIVMPGEGDGQVEIPGDDVGPGDGPADGRKQFDTGDDEYPDSGDAQSSSDAIGPSYGEEQVTFLKKVIIEPGVQLRGGADFMGAVEFLGTKEKPIVWQGQEEARNASYFHGKSAKASWVQLEHVTWMVDASTDSRFDGTAISVNKGHIGFQSYNSFRGGPSALKLTQSDFTDSSLTFACQPQIVDGGLSDDNSSYAQPGYALLQVEHTVFNKSSVDLSCFHEGDYLARYRLQKNNFLQPGSYYFSSHGNHGETSGSLPADTVWEVEINQNFFQDPTQLYYGVDDFGWRFGDNLPEAWPDAGLP